MSRWDKEPADAATGMIFVFAAFLPQEKGVVFERTELNEAKDFESTGTTRIAAIGPEEIGETATLRFDLKRGDGTTLPIWVNAEREIVQVDWGGGNMMVLAPESTKHLYRPVEPALTVVTDGPDKLVMEGHFPGLAPEELFDHWTTVELLAKWWPPEAEVGSEVGGAYELSWKQGGWFLEGEITAYERGKRFGFTWKWRHDGEDAPALEVTVAFVNHEKGGTRLTVTHGPYTDDEEGRKARAGHLQGWQQCCSRLKSIRD